VCSSDLTSSRFIVFDREGSVIALAQAEHAQIYPAPGHVEHDATEIWTKTQSVMREALDGNEDQKFDVLLATVSPYDAQDYTDSGEDVVEKVAIPPGLIDWIKAFIDQHHEDEVFIKRRRDKRRVDQVEDGVGDERIAQFTDVYRAPSRPKSETMH